MNTYITQDYVYRRHDPILVTALKQQVSYERFILQLCLIKIVCVSKTTH